MVFQARRSMRMDVKKIYKFLHFLLTLLMIILVSFLAGCAPSAGTTLEPAALAVADTNSTPTMEVPTRTATPTATPTPTITTLTFAPQADAWVEEKEPDDNEGEDEKLEVDGESDPDIEAYIRFNITGLSGTVLSAQLRLYADGENSDNGPAIYLSDPAWEETEITWNTRPARTSNALDNKREISEGTWAEFHVTSAITGNGMYSFVFIADDNNGIDFSSREGNNPPKLVITLSSGPPPTATPTLPPEAFVVVGAGDISTCGNENDEMTAQLLDAIPGIIFTTGDNVYDDGTHEEFMQCFGPTWGRHKDRIRPIPGDHDYGTEDGAGYFAYFSDIPPYYAYDQGNWRLYALNTEIDLSEESEQIAWLQTDLAENPRQCVLAYWHEPRWSSGIAHGSYDDYQDLWEIFYEADAELVINGDEHNYERFAEMDASGSPSSPGLRAIVIGTGGKSLYELGTPLPASEVREDSSYGVLKLILYPDRYDWEFVPAAGYTFTDRGSTMCH